jgi:hypothetical protein
METVPSLLLALLDSDPPKASQYVPNRDLEDNIAAVKDSITNNRKDIRKNFAAKKLYETLYEIIETAYKREKDMTAQEIADNEKYNVAIGIALSRMISESKTLSDPDPRIIALREKLAQEIRAALTP